MISSNTDASLVDVVMPQMGTSVVEGTVVAWSAEVGQAIDAEQTICEISSDKIDTEVPASASGTLIEILVPVGETVGVGTVLGRILSSAAGPARADEAAVGALPNDGRYSPVVRRIAAEHSVDLVLVAGTGRAGRVRKNDVLAYIERGGNGAAAPVDERQMHIESPYQPEPTPAAVQAAAVSDAYDLGGVAQPLSRMRQSIGAAMLRSQQTAAVCHTVVECDMSRVEQRRRELGVTALPLVARATIDTLREFPELNATLDGTTITRYERVHLGIAVSLGADGLIVPVIHDAQDLSPQGLATRIKDAGRRARAKQLTADDVRGATFTITNPGQYGALIATPVINQPQVGILDLEAIVKRPVVVAAADGSDAITILPLVNLILGWDHRAVDGVYAAQFLTALRHRIESPGGL